jgi:hypothetical protein
MATRNKVANQVAPINKVANQVDSQSGGNHEYGSHSVILKNYSSISIN